MSKINENDALNNHKSLENFKIIMCHIFQASFGGICDYAVLQLKLSVFGFVFVTHIFRYTSRFHERLCSKFDRQHYYMISSTILLIIL